MTGYVYIVRWFVYVAATVILCLMTGCLKAGPLPADWPVSRDVLPNDAQVLRSCSPGKFKPQNADTSTYDLYESLASDDNWVVEFTTSLTKEVFQEHIENVLRQAHYLFSDLEPSDEDDLDVYNRQYFSPDGKYVVEPILEEGSGRYILLVAEINVLREHLKSAIEL